MNKLTIVLLADTASKENEGRALHALLYAKQAHEAGMDASLIFDGGGVEWAEELQDEENQMSGQYEELLEAGVIKGVCRFCADAFDVKSSIKELQFLDEDEGHPNIGKRIKDGERVITI